MNNYPTLSQKMLDAIATVMDDDIREELHSTMSPCEPGEFLTAYLERDPSLYDVINDYQTSAQ